MGGVKIHETPILLPSLAPVSACQPCSGMKVKSALPSSFDQVQSASYQDRAKEALGELSQLKLHLLPKKLELWMGWE